MTRIRPALRRSLTLIATFALALSAAASFAEEVNEKTPNGDFVLNGNAEAGAQTYKVFCIACHGEKGDGNGPAGAALNPKPGNYTNYERMSHLSDKYLFTIVSEGGAFVGKSPMMVSWKAALSEQQRRDVIAFVKTFAKKPAE